MKLSKIQEKYDVNSTALNKFCWENGVVPIFNCSDFYIDRYKNIYRIQNIIGKLQLEKLEPVGVVTKRMIPVYLLKNDKNRKVRLRLDVIYLCTKYGPMPSSSIAYTKNEIFTYSKKLYYTVHKYQRVDEKTILVNDIEFKLAQVGTPVYASKDGALFNDKLRQFCTHLSDFKFYKNISCRDNNNNTVRLKVHRMVYQAWKLNGEKLSSDIPIDHKDGFKNHNWIENLEETTHRDNFRKSGYNQNLRMITWTPEIIERLCQLLEKGIYGPKDIADILKSEFKDFNNSYSSIKHKIYEIVNGEFWTDISSKYNVDNYTKMVNTHNNIATEDEIIHKICKAYITKKYSSNRELADDINVSYSIVNRVIRGEYRRDISSQYNFEYPKRKHGGMTEDEVKQICDSIMIDRRSVENTAKIFHRDKKIIRKIMRRELFPDISKKYNFEKYYPKYNYMINYTPYVSMIFNSLYTPNRDMKI